MGKNGLEPINYILTNLKNEYRFVCKELSRSPGGELKIVSEHGYTRYIQVTREGNLRNRKGISRDTKLIGKLAHKCFLEEKKARLAENIKLIESIAGQSLSINASDILSAMPARFDTIDKEIILSGRRSKYKWPIPSRDSNVFPRPAALTTGGLSPEEWAAMPYCENTSFPEFKTHLTSRGIACRSKSEVAILEKYDALHIPFHCDETMVFGHSSFAPDVVGARSDGMLIYHEHFGVQDADYRRKREWKMNLYDSVGIRPGKNLICTYDHEDGSINMELIDAQIRDMYML